jgi:hypothetical protein
MGDSRTVRCFAVALSLIAAAACGSDERDVAPPMEVPPAKNEEPTPAGAPTLVLQLGEDLAPALRSRITGHLQSRAKVTIAAPNDRLEGLLAGASIVAIGETATSRLLVSDDKVASLGPEGFAIASGEIGDAHVRALAARGSPKTPTKVSSAVAGRIATAFAAYAVLEDLGFGFLHPLQPTIPDALTAIAPPAARREEPRWPLRGLQLHTMHPLELTNLLEGWGPGGPDDEQGFKDMLPEWDRFLEWLLANGQNRVHWVLLEAEAWKEFSTSERRRLRLTELVEHAHAFGITAGADVPIALQQQHTFRLVRPNGDLADELAQLRGRVDWIMSAGFDYIATENGTTEFTHPPATRMLAWMNELARHVAERHHKPTYVKLHCSTGQKADGFVDPATGLPINFNYLPHFADSRLGVMPHTVQHYGLDDPAPTYGNTDFGYVRDFLRREVGLREVVWHPETAYWVSFDVDVPIFLPVYAERRLHDLRLIGGDEEAKLVGVGAHAGKRMDGQQTFSSGWEWGYWLNDVVTARASWDPHLEAASDDAALTIILDRALRVLGPAGIPVRDLVIETARVQRELLIEGRVGGVKPASVVRKNGQAYLQGTETWDDVSELGTRIPGIEAAQMTQPARLGLVEMRSPIRTGPRYTGEIEPLLAEMEKRFAALAMKWDAVRAQVPAAALPLFDDMADAMRVTARRATQVHGLYDYVDARDETNAAPRLARLSTARAALDSASTIVKGREARYRVPAERIAGWGVNPTAYKFGYLWTARSLYYWWRDEGQAVDAPRSPCYLNVLAMTEVGIGEGALNGGSSLLRTILDNPAAGGDAAECLSDPSSAPAFPQLGLRTRP